MLVAERFFEVLIGMEELDQQARLDDAPAEFVDGWLRLSEALGNRTSFLEKEK